MAINRLHKDYIYWNKIWQKSREGIDGQETIKSKRTKYLPQLGGQDNISYNAYLDRANYINFSNRILQIAIGQLFRKSPNINFDNQDFIQEIKDNIDLSGTSLINFSKELFREVMVVNRCGILVDFNIIKKRPYLTMYKAENIINWRYSVDPIDNTKRLSMVVLEGITEVEDPKDRYNVIHKKVWRELYLDEEGIYQYKDWEEERPGVFIYTQGETPLKNDQVLDYIPFYFITSYGIVDNINRAPLLDIINVNLSHYRNNADYENMIHWTGAKTVITKLWNSGQSDKPFPIGGCADFNAPEGDAKFLEARSDSALYEELKHKEEIMATLGSALLSGKGRYIASAETARITSEGEYATLADISYTISDAMSIVLKEMCTYLYALDIANTISIDYNTDFEVSELQPQTLLAWLTAVEKGLMSKQTYFYNMQNKEMYPDGWTLEKEIIEVKPTTLKQNISQGDNK